VKRCKQTSTGSMHLIIHTIYIYIYIYISYTYILTASVKRCEQKLRACTYSYT
jgi:hypothetical protein